MSKMTAALIDRGQAMFFLLCVGGLLASCVQHPPGSDTPGATAVKPIARARPPRVARTIEPLPPTPEQRLGTVRVIGARGSFVLIETPSAYAATAVPVGYLLHCHPPGVTAGISTADLRVSVERRQPFIVADVVAGSPSVGDVAYLARDVQPTRVPIRPVVPFSSVIPAAEPAATPPTP